MAVDPYFLYLKFRRNLLSRLLSMLCKSNIHVIKSAVKHHTPPLSPASSSALSSSARAPAVLANFRRALCSIQTRLPAASASSLPQPSLPVLSDVSLAQCFPQTHSRHRNVNPKHALDGTSARFDRQSASASATFLHCTSTDFTCSSVSCAREQNNDARARHCFVSHVLYVRSVYGVCVQGRGTPCASCISLRVISWASSMRSSATMFMYSSHLCMHRLKPGCFQVDKLRSTRLLLSLTASI